MASVFSLERVVGEGKLHGAGEQLGGERVEKAQVSNSFKNRGDEEVGQDTSPHRVAFPKSGLGFSGQTRGCNKNGPSLYLANAST